MAELKLGRFEYCLNVADLSRSLGFYRKLGFEMIGGVLDEGWAIVRHGDCTLGLFQGHIATNLLNFRGGDVFAIAKELEARGLELSREPQIEDDGSAAAEIHDPDGNRIYFNTFPGEEI